MKASSIPTKYPEVFGKNAAAAQIRTVPQTTVDPNAASFDLGFPPNTFVQVASGGAPPDGRDFNGILNTFSAWLQWAQAGGAPITYDATFQAAIGGYPNGAIVGSATTAGKYWRSTVDDNATNPDTGGAGWVSFLPAGQQLAGGQCYLQFGSSTSITLAQKNGSNVIVNGAQISISAAGVTAGNTGVLVNGAAGNLAASTVYLVSLYLNGSTPTLAYWALGTYTHAPDTATANLGVEVIKTVSGGALHSDHSFVGWIQTNGSSQFSDTAASRLVASWFNRQRKTLAGAQAAVSGIPGSTLVELDTGARVLFISTGIDAVEASLSGWGNNTTGGGSSVSNIGIDGPSSVFCNTSSQATSGAVNALVTHAPSGSGLLSEGGHFLTPVGSIGSSGGGTAGFQVSLQGTVMQ